MVAGIIGLLSSYRCQCSNRNRWMDRWILRKTHGWSLPDFFLEPKNNGMSLSPTTPKRDIQLGTKKWDDYPRVKQTQKLENPCCPAWKIICKWTHPNLDPSVLGFLGLGWISEFPLLMAENFYFNSMFHGHITLNPNCSRSNLPSLGVIRRRTPKKPHIPGKVPSFGNWDDWTIKPTQG